MAKLTLKAGTTSKDINVFVQDSSKTDGSGLTGLAYNTSSLSAYYHRQGANAAVAISLATKTLGTWASAGFVVVDGTNLPGVYELGIPDAALAAGATWVVIMLKGAANMAPVVLEIELTAVDNQDAVAFGLSRLDAAIGDVKGKTDNLPSDPADASDIAAAFAAVPGAVWANATRTLSAFGFSVTAGTVSDKTGYKLASDGLDSISTTAPAGVASNFREMVVALWRRAFKKSTLTSTQLKTFADDGSTVLTTQAVSDDGSIQTVGNAT